VGDVFSTSQVKDGVEDGRQAMTAVQDGQW
jgi:hypothetical protein